MATDEQVSGPLALGLWTDEPSAAPSRTSSFRSPPWRATSASWRRRATPTRRQAACRGHRCTETALDSSLDAEELRLAIRRLQADFGLEHDVAQDIDDYDGFRAAMLTLAYQERRNAQEDH